MSRYEPELRHCGTCGKLIITGKARDLVKEHLYCNPECAATGRRKTVWPPSSVVAGLLRYYPVSFLSKKLKVSDVAVRKFCIKHQVPLPKRGYWAKRYANEEKQKREKRTRAVLAGHQEDKDRPDPTGARSNRPDPTGARSRANEVPEDRHAAAPSPEPNLARAEEAPVKVTRQHVWQRREE